jgi:uncharacterized protein YeaO (DUF488 family)
VTVSIVRLGSDRLPGEGLRIGAVRYPPRGVPKSEHASGNWYDVWYPELAPSREAVKQGKEASAAGEAGERDWNAFVKRYRREMGEAAPRHTIELLAALSHTADFSLGCYCQEEARCHRSVLRELLAEAGAAMD